VSKQSHPEPIFNLAYYGGAQAERVIKIRPKHFLAVRTGNDKNCTAKASGAKRSHLDPVFNFVYNSGAGLEKLSKFDRFFFSVLMGNDKNCPLKSVGMFWALNRVIQTRFSTLPAR